VEDPLLTTLNETAQLLASVGETRASNALTTIAEPLAQGSQDAEVQTTAARLVLRMYSGMGSFGDLVLQDANGVLPEQAEFDRLRQRLFEAARAALGTG
jgi:hypothetical protein